MEFYLFFVSKLSQFHRRTALSFGRHEQENSKSPKGTHGKQMENEVMSHYRLP